MGDRGPQRGRSGGGEVDIGGFDVTEGGVFDVDQPELVGVSDGI